MDLPPESIGGLPLEEAREVVHRWRALSSPDPIKSKTTRAPIPAPWEPRTPAERQRAKMLKMGRDFRAASSVGTEWTVHHVKAGVLTRHEVDTIAEVKRLIRGEGSFRVVHRDARR